MKLFLVLAFSIFSSLAYGQIIDGQDRGNGGDPCEERIDHIRTDLRLWILMGHSSALQLPPEITLPQYNQAMLEKTATAFVSCTTEVLTVGEAEKTCLNFNDDQGLPRIVCNYDRFMNAQVSAQYVLVHHEFAGLAKFEVNSGEKSDYRISSQISNYFPGDNSPKSDKKCPMDDSRPVSERVATAIYDNNLDCLRYLVPKMAFTEMLLVYRFNPLDLTLQGENFFMLPPISFAAALNRVGAIQIFLDAGFNINFSEPGSVYYPLSLAAKAGSFEAIQLLVKRGAFLNLESETRYNPLHAALSNLNEKSYPLTRIYKTVETLLQLGADPDVVSFHETPLSMAAEHFDLVDLLIKYGASPLKKNGDGRMPIESCRTKVCVDKFTKLAAEYKEKIPKIAR